MPLLIFILNACGIRNTDTPDDSLVGGDDDSNPVLHNYSTEVAELYDKDGDGYLSTETPQNILDQINDGYYANTPSEVKLGDCNDDPANGGASVNPGATEIPYDGIDQDCKDGDLVDVDGDGYDAGARGSDNDCDDDNFAVNPGVIEVCNNHIDDNCDASDNEECELRGEMSLATADHKWQGQTGEELGISLLGLDDVNADGYPDGAIGVNYLSNGPDETGGVQIVSGGEVGTRNFGKILATIHGENDDDWFGYSVAQMGDQLLVGAPRASTGTAYVFDGPFTGDIYATNVAKLYSSTALGLGGSVAGGDVTGDGISDSIIGAESYNEAYPYAQGAVYVMASPVVGDIDLNINYTARLVGASDVDYAGTALVIADINGDGFNDIIVGARNNMDVGAVAAWSNPAFYLGNGAVYVKYGPVSGDSDLAIDADATLLGPTAGENAGSSLAAREIDGDQYADLLIGAPTKNGPSGEHEVGAVYLLHGPIAGEVDLTDPSVTTFSTGIEGDTVGGSVSFAGDVNADGAQDILIGANGSSNGGQAYLCYGPFTSSTVDLNTSCQKFIAEQPGDYAGWPVAGVGDLNKDGFYDLITAAIGTRNQGIAYFTLGRGM